MMVDLIYNVQSSSRPCCCPRLQFAGIDHSSQFPPIQLVQKELCCERSYLVVTYTVTTTYKTRHKHLSSLVTLDVQAGLLVCGSKFCISIALGM